MKVTVPDIGDAKDVEVIELCVAPGDLVEANAPLIVVESEKASMEVPSPASGILQSLFVQLGSLINAGDVIAEIEGPEMVSEEPVPEPAAPLPVAAAQVVEAGTPSGEDARSDAIRRNEGALSTATISVPDIGDAAGVVVIEILVKPGDLVSAADPLVVIESEKASMEIPSPVNGQVDHIHVKLDQEVSQGTPIVSVKTSDTESSIPSGRHSSEESREGPAHRQPTDPSQPPEPCSEDPTESRGAESPHSDSAEPAGNDTAGQYPSKSASPVYAGPAVRRIAREMGVDLSAVAATGARGRILKDDVKQHVKRLLARRAGTAPLGAGESSVALPDFTEHGEIDNLPLTRMEARGALNLSHSWRHVVHVTGHDEADVSDLEDFRKKVNADAEQGSVRLTLLPFIVKACAATLAEFPKFNSSIDPSLKSLIVKKYCNIGMAVDTADGLIVPVIRNASAKGLLEIAVDVQELATLARAKRLMPAQLSGATFTVSSLGLLGGTGFTPIINHPEVAILGVARMAVMPVWDGSAFAPRKIVPLSLSYDHRAINGAEAGRFMRALVARLSDVRRLIL